MTGVVDPPPPPPVEVADTVKEGIVRAVLAFVVASVRVIVQFVYVPTLNALNVIVLFPTVAEVVIELQLPPYVMVHASFVVNV